MRGCAKPGFIHYLYTASFIHSIANDKIFISIVTAMHCIWRQSINGSHRQLKMIECGRGDASSLSVVLRLMADMIGLSSVQLERYA